MKQAIQAAKVAIQKLAIRFMEHGDAEFSRNKIAFLMRELEELKRKKAILVSKVDELDV